MLDIHFHILDKVDDGPKSFSEAIEMLKIAALDGTKSIFATPHYIEGFYETKPTEIYEKVNKLNLAAEKENIPIKIFSGQEIMLNKKTKKLYKREEIITLNNSKYMLIELPMDKLPEDALEEIYELRLLGIIPIIAHPERYEFIISKPTLINDFIKEGCFFQINSGSIRGVFGKQVQKTSEKLIKHGICNFIASDAHSLLRRKPGINKALELLKAKDEKLYNQILDNYNKIEKNEQIHHNMEIIKEKRSIIEIVLKKH